MIRTTQTPYAIKFSLSPKIQLVERVIEETNAFLPKSSSADFTPVKVVLRELLLNAIQHGSGSQGEGQISCSIERNDDMHLKIVVEDQGDGFDPQLIDMSLPEDANRAPNRGYALISALSDRLEFNEKANQVAAHLIIPKAENGAFDGHLEREWFRAMRNETSLSLIVVNVDSFKEYSEHYGPQKGEDCLKRIEGVLKKSAKRSTDLVASYRDSGFVALLPETPAEGSQHVGEEMRRNVEEQKIEHAFSDAAEWVTISNGLATWIPVRNQSPEDFFRLANDAVGS